MRNRINVNLKLAADDKGKTFWEAIHGVNKNYRIYATNIVGQVNKSAETR